jgi:hypothetical protein
VKAMSKILPPRGEDCTWRWGPPPSIGWWPASVSRAPQWLRWWDGKKWSRAAHCSDGDHKAGLIVAQGKSEQRVVEWTDRWWLGPERLTVAEAMKALPPQELKAVQKMRKRGCVVVIIEPEALANAQAVSIEEYLLAAAEVKLKYLSLIS